ncbi:fimbria/pilus outer membrane usher protein [Serratia proteamaculans]|uniref:fimbria/pilus outer membrane usher protein n=1 Tax=Serratia proteamaculans TaxID=28151 RepID=UPI002179ED19|nr:fimbria/pilus outer membrane usher protein [Serratia proteamaculans]CAI1525189.1 Outer membrane usher protein fimD precursor [Serratia proteamaculans]
MKNYNHPHWLIKIAATGIGLIGLPTAASGYYFDPAALEMQDPAQQPVDLENLYSSGGEIPGDYRVDIYLNDNFIETRSVKFIKSAENKLAPELTAQQLSVMGLKNKAFPALEKLPVEQPITDIASYIPDASTHFNFEQQRLDISIPQAALDSKARGYVDPVLWDQGLPALLFNYTSSGANTQRNSQAASENNYYFNLQSGANLGAWRLRNYSTYTRDDQGQQKWSSVNTYLQRDIHALKSQFIAGQSTTPGMVFDSNQFTGVQLASDDSMLPDSLKGFAPSVRGIAQSNAQVTIRQNGYVIYQTYVAPGAFEISDLYPTSASGDLHVTITEANGSEHTFVQPFSAVPIMLRQGQLKYSLAGGRYRSANANSQTPNFSQTSLIYGLAHSTTLYGGLLGAENYWAASLGLGHGFGDIGSLSADITQAKSKLPNNTDSTGQSYRIQYSKDIALTGTTFTLASYRYSTEGFYTFQEVNEIGTFPSGTPGNSNVGYNYNKRSKSQLNLNQSFKEYGSIYISAYQQDYWRMKGYQRTINTGYSQSIYGISYSLNYSYSQTPGAQTGDKQLSFSMQVPLSRFLANSWATYSINSGSNGSVTQQAGLSGTALADNNLSYTVQQSLANQGQGNSGSASARYQGSHGEINGGYNYSSDSQQFNYGMQGGVVVHPYGVTFSQPLGDTVALVRAPGAANLKLENNTGVYTDSRGYAVVPYVSTYRNNRIGLDTRSMGDNVDIETTVQNVVPTRGAVTLANFKTRLGSRVIMTLSYQGKPVPLGANATLVEEDQGQPNSAWVGDGGQVYISGVPEKGTLRVQWGKTGNKQCTVDFTLPAVKDNEATALRIFDAVCH